MKKWFNFSTMKEKFYICFELEKNKKGTEHIYFKNTKMEEERIIHNFETRNPKIKAKKYKERNRKSKIKLRNDYVTKKFKGNSRTYYIIRMFKIKFRNEEFVIQDDYNEKNSRNRIGTTITNLLNKSQIINTILNEGLENLAKIDEKQIKKMCAKIEESINKFKLKHYNTNEILNKLYTLIEFLEKCKINKNQEVLDYELKEYLCEIKNDETFAILYSFYEEVYPLKKEFGINDVELNMIIEKLIEGKEDVREVYNFYVPLRIVKNTIRRIKRCKLKDGSKYSLNFPLQYLVEQSFWDFNKDYQMLQDKQKIQEFLTISLDHYNNRLYNTYYKNISEYMNTLYNKYIHEMKNYKMSHKQDKILPKKFQDFSYKDMATIFLNSFLEDMNFFNRNYNSRKLDYSNIKISGTLKNEFNISSFRELFYISKYYIYKVNYKIKKCNLCDKFFIAEISTNSNCERLNKKTKKTCREFAEQNNKSYNKKLVEKTKDKIEDILGKLYENGKIEAKDMVKIREYFENLEDKKSLQIIFENLEEEYNSSSKEIHIANLLNKWENNLELKNK